MNTETRKMQIMNWLSALNNESVLDRIEELKKETQRAIPSEIYSLLDSSNSCNRSELIKHTTVRDLLGYCVGFPFLGLVKSREFSLF